MTDLESPKKNNDCYFYYYSTCVKVTISIVFGNDQETAAMPTFIKFGIIWFSYIIYVIFGAHLVREIVAKNTWNW